MNKDTCYHRIEYEDIVADWKRKYEAQLEAAKTANDASEKLVDMLRKERDEAQEKAVHWSQKHDSLAKDIEVLREQYEQQDLEARSEVDLSRWQKA